MWPHCFWEIKLARWLFLCNSLIKSKMSWLVSLIPFWIQHLHMWTLSTLVTSKARWPKPSNPTPRWIHEWNAGLWRISHLPVYFPNVLPCNTAVIEQSVVLWPNPNKVIFPSNFFLFFLYYMCRWLGQLKRLPLHWPAPFTQSNASRCCVPLYRPQTTQSTWLLLRCRPKWLSALPRSPCISCCQTSSLASYKWVFYISPLLSLWNLLHFPLCEILSHFLYGL